MHYLLDQILAILSPRPIEYLVLDENFKIIEMSWLVQRFADFPERVILGEDIRLGFPEFIGLEDSLTAIRQGQQNCFELKGICRYLGNNSPLYIDIHALLSHEESIFENQLILLFEDVTERMVMQQDLVHTANKANLLLSALATSKSYIDKIIASMVDALLVTNVSGKIKTVNQASQDLFGYSEQELINQPISNIIIEKDFLSKLIHQYCLFQKGEILKNLEVICQTKNGEEIIVSFSCSAIQTDIQELPDIVYVGRDITLAKRAEAELHHALAREKELNEFKSRFVSMVSHEFGNPLITVLMSVELLKKYSSRKTEEEKLKYLDHIQIAAEQMSQLLKDVLAIGQAEVGKLKFNPAPLDLIKFCGDVVEEIKLGAGHGQLTISFAHTGLIAGEGNQEEMLLLDEKLLRHILTNLLSNAVKYSPQGGTVHFDLLCRNTEVIFLVKDQGIGIPLEDQKQLFESFYRAKNVGTIPGTGLGLTIVKQSVDLHGGKIEVTSDVGLGTTFTVTLPLSQKAKCR